jgi:hypothetical protein
MRLGCVSISSRYDLTTQVINRRAKSYRNLVITVAIVFICSIGAAVVAQTLWPLTGFLVLIPICGFYFFLDNKLLNEWRSQLMESWVKEDLIFRYFYDAINAVPTLPKETLRDMLVTLPKAINIKSKTDLTTSTRQATEAAVSAIFSCRSDALAYKAVSHTIFTGSIIAASGFGMWIPLVGILAVVPIPVLLKRVRIIRLRNTRVKIQSALEQPDFDQQKYQELVEHFDWSPISASEKSKFCGIGAAAPGD